MEGRNYPPFETWAIDLRERFPLCRTINRNLAMRLPASGWTAPDFHRMTVEEFEALPPHIWMDVKKTLPPLEHPV